MTEAQPQQSNNKAYLYALIGNILLAIMQTSIKQASDILSPFQVLYFRSIFLIIISLVSVGRAGKSPYIPQPTLFRYVVLRMLVMNFAVIIMFYCLKYLPVSTATTLYNIGPIFIFFIQAIYYRKPLKRMGLCLATVSFTGVVLIVQPQFIFGSHQGQQFYVQGFSWYVVLMLSSAVGYACNMLLIHILAKKIPPIVNLHQSNLGFLLASAFLCSFIPHSLSLSDITWKLVLIVLATVVTGFLTQLFIIRANSIAKPSVVMPFGYISVAMGFLADVYLFGTHFTALAVVGMILTSAGLLGNFLSQKFQRKKEDEGQS